MNADLYAIFGMSVICFLVYAYDKHAAYYHRGRVPEFLMLSLALLGGSPGALMAMLLFRHKTKHPSFIYSVPIFLILLLVVEVYCRLKFKV